ncbi:hypothetical protein STEG23_027780 [Scotinomys teguina]
MGNFGLFHEQWGARGGYGEEEGRVRPEHQKDNPFGVTGVTTAVTITPAAQGPTTDPKSPEPESMDKGCLQGPADTRQPEMELRALEIPEDGDTEEDTAMALQRLVELTGSRVISMRSLRVQYRLIRKLGSGSYGRVLLAQPRQGGQTVALKLLRRDSVLRTTFLREFCVGRCVSSHPGLLQTLGRPLQTPQHFAFAQEYAPCGDLSGMLQEKARLDRTA